MAVKKTIQTTVVLVLAIGICVLAGYIGSLYTTSLDTCMVCRASET